MDAAHALYEIVSTTFNPDFVGNFADGDPNSEGDSPGGGLYTGQDKPFWDALTTHVGGSDGSNLLGVTSGYAQCPASYLLYMLTGGRHDHGESWCARSATERIPIWCVALRDLFTSRTSNGCTCSASTDILGTAVTARGIETREYSNWI